MATPRFLLDMEQGATFEYNFNWYAGGKFMAPIEDICIGYPTRIKVTAHGLPTISDTPVILSGIDGADILNSHDLGIEEAVYVDADHFDMPISTVKDKWVVGSGEMTYHKPTDITDYTARMQIRENWHATDIIHELTTENAGIVLTVEDAGIAITILPVDTEAFTFNVAVYDIEMISPSGQITRVIEGTVTLHKEVTK
jgi:hypothetical protein